MSIACDLISSSEAFIEFGQIEFNVEVKMPETVGSNAIKADNTIEFNEVRW